MTIILFKPKGEILKPYFLLPLLLLTSCSDAYSPIIFSNSCFIDRPFAGAILPADSNFVVTGWMFDNQADTTPKHVRVQFTSINRQGTKTFDAEYGIYRPDVALAKNAPTATSAGFNLEVSAKSLAPGKYEIMIIQNIPNLTLVCANRNMIEVK